MKSVEMISSIETKDNSLGFNGESLKRLNDNDLLLRFGKLVRTERKITHLVLACIAEIDTRRLFLEKAYPSLYEFLTKEFGYSPSAAVRRIESARLLREVPEISHKIESGALNLSQLSQLQQAVRTATKTDNKKIPTEQKRELIGKIERSTQKETELILAKELSLPAPTENKERIHQNESVTLTITFTKEEMEALTQARSLAAHSLESHNWSHFLSYLCRKEIKRRAPAMRDLNSSLKLNTNAQQRKLDTNCEQQDKTKPSLKIAKTLQPPVTNCKKPSLTSPIRRYLSTKIKKNLLATQKCCQFKDPFTGRMCGSTHFLQADHIQPVWAGGTNKKENLQLLCAQHNRFKYKNEAGIHPLRW